MKRSSFLKSLLLTAIAPALLADIPKPLEKKEEFIHFSNLDNFEVGDIVINSKRDSFRVTTSNGKKVLQRISNKPNDYQIIENPSEPLAKLSCSYKERQYYADTN